MPPGFRVFCGEQTAPSLEALVDYLRASSFNVACAARCDDEGWYHCRLELATEVCVIERFCRDEEGIVGQLQAWAAWVEEHASTPEHEDLIAHLATCPQVLVIGRDSIAEADTGFARAVADWLAARAEGIIQAEGVGFLRPDGTIVLKDEPTVESE